MASRKNSQRNKLVILCLLLSILLCGFSLSFLLRSYKDREKIDELNKTIEEQQQTIDEHQQTIDELQQQNSTSPEVIAEEVIPEEETESMTEGPVAAPTINVGELPAGTEVSVNHIYFSKLEQYFQGYEIPNEVLERINGKSYQPDGQVALGELRYLKVLHYDFNNKIKVGELIVATELMKDYLDIFQKLFEGKYQIYSMHLVDNYWTGDADESDSASIDVNNTSAFNYRMATGSNTLSKHAFGRAIDINPQQNPYVSYASGSAKWYHDNATDYIDRETGAAHMITENDLCYQLFTEYGFEWGGHWDTIKDYQHFEKK